MNLHSKNIEFTLLETILNHVDEGIHVVNNEGKTIFYNHRAAAIDGFEPKEVLGKHIFEIYPSLTNETSTLIKTLLTGQPTEERQQTFINNKGQKITTINRTIPVRLFDQSPGALEISREITQLQDLINKISLLRDQLHHPDNPITPADGTKYTFEHIVGNHPELVKAIDYARKASMTSSSILLYGETGTGKEVFAQSIHNASPRRDKPFIAQNCAALPKDLLESLLFGTEKGSFTGALSRAGLFEQANGGTLLLDEINSMNIDLQAKLLRVLQDGRVRRVGGSKEKPIDVRIIATSNIPPEKALKENKIRADLFYRLGVVLLHIPPLRERINDDLSSLVQYFINLYNHKFNKCIYGISNSVRKIFQEYHWPGNVRELQHLIEGGFNLIDNHSVIQPEHLPHYLVYRLQNHSHTEQINLTTRDFSIDQPLTAAVEQLESQLIKDALEKTSGNISKSAELLQIKRQALQYKIKKYGLKVK